MKIENVPFTVTKWSEIPRSEHPGEKGRSFWRTFEQGNIRVRMVEHSPGYLADHWCPRGHVVLVLAGEVTTELKDGRKFKLTPGMSFQVADNDGEHRSYTARGVKLFIVD